MPRLPQVTLYATARSFLFSIADSFMLSPNRNSVKGCERRARSLQSEASL